MTKPTAGLIFVPWTIVIAAILIAVFVRGRDNRGEASDLARQGFLRSLVPPATRDFWLAFTGRFLFILAIVMLSTFQLFTLTDYLHQSIAKAGAIISLATLIFGVLAAVAVIITGPLSDRISRRKPFVIGAPILIGLALIPVLASPSVSPTCCSSLSLAWRSAHTSRLTRRLWSRCFPTRRPRLVILDS